MTGASGQSQAASGPADHAGLPLMPGGTGASLHDELLRHALNGSADAIMIFEAAGLLVWANESACHALIASGPHCSGVVSWPDLWSENSRPQALTVLSAATRPMRFTGRRSFRSRPDQWWECQLSPLNRPGDQAGRILCIARDITGQRTEESSLRESEMRYRSLFENSVDGIFQVGPDGAALLANKALARILGVGSAQLLVQDWPHFASESFADQSRLTEFLGRLATQTEVKLFEYQLRRRDGTLVWVSISARPLRDAHGRLLGYEGNVKDISARRQADRLIREQADFINRAHNAITVTDLAGHFTLWNKGAERIFGWSATEMLGRRTTEFAGPHAPRLREIDGLVLANGDWRGEFQITGKAGNLIMLDAQFTLIHDENGKPTGRLCIASDITEKKSLEDRAFHAQRLEGIGMLAAGIAHDLNNILAPILMAAPMLRDEVTSPGGRQLLAMMEKGAVRGASLVRQILNFSHRASHKHEPVLIRHLLRDLANFMHETFPKTIRCEEQASPDLWMVEGNATQLHQVLLNLCVNARDAMADGGQLRLSAQNQVLDPLAAARHPHGRAGGFVLIQVRDTGTGIPPEILAHIWEPFFTTKGPDKGTGLGLATVRGIVENHGGFISLESEPGSGSTFSVWLPAKENQPGKTIPPFPPRPSGGNSELILVVDDEQSIRELIRTVLTRHGYRVVTASDGVEATAVFAAGEFEVALMLSDLQMPSLDGLALIQSVRQIRADMKIIAMSGSRSDGSKTGAADAILPKPFTIEELLAAVQTQLASAAMS